MRILFALTYYRPHVSGLTIYVERLAAAFARRGHQATVLTSQFDPNLPRTEIIEGVRVIRVPVVGRVSKGVLMPTIGMVATRLTQEHDVLSLHLPQFDAAGIALRGVLMHKPVVLTHHCDLSLPAGPFNWVVDQVVLTMNWLACVLADRIVTYTQDYAEHSPLLRRFDAKLTTILPPVVMPAPGPESVAEFKRLHAADASPIIGFGSRFAAEKGVEYLVGAMPSLVSRFPNLKVLFAGHYLRVLGEEQYWQRLRPQIGALGAHWEFLGNLEPSAMPAFFGACDVLTVPSLNSTESFGLVQVESMLCGTPVVASDLPGVRQPIRMTGMGEIVPPRDSEALAAALTKVIERPEPYRRERSEIERQFDLDSVVAAYEQLFETELARKANAGGRAPP